MTGGCQDLSVLFEPLRKISGKRCLSPPKQQKRSIKRKTNNPTLILNQAKTNIQLGVGPESPARQGNPCRINISTETPAEQRHPCSLNISTETPAEQRNPCRINISNTSDPVISHGDQLLPDHQEPDVIRLKPYLTRLEPVLRQQEPDLSRLESDYHEDLSPDTAQMSELGLPTEDELGSLTELQPNTLNSLQALTSLDAPSITSFGTPLPSSFGTPLPSSFGTPSFNSTSVPWPTTQGSVSRQTSGGTSLFSTSYTSWTKPEVGHRISDSCVPNSSILDISLPVSIRSRSLRRSKKTSRMLKRDSSSDTSKDIDDIEDFEFDGGLDELLHDDEDELTETKRSSTLMESPDLLMSPDPIMSQDLMMSQDLVMTPDLLMSRDLVLSPDLAYGSMNPSGDEASK